MGAFTGQADAAQGREATHTFPLDRSMVGGCRSTGALCFLFSAVLLVWATIDLRPWEAPASGDLLTLAIFAIFTAIGGALGYFGFIQAPRRTVCVDDDGLWLSGKPCEDHFVPWEEVRRLRERFLLQRLEVFDHNGNLRIKVDLQIDDFRTFGLILMERTRHCRHLRPIVSSHWVQPMKLYFATGWLIGAITVWILRGEGSLRSDWFYLALVAVPVIFFVRTPIGLRIEPDHIEFIFVWRRRIVPRDAIERVELATNLTNGMQTTGSIVHLAHGAGMLEVSGFATCGLELHETLEDWFALELDPAEGL